MKPILIALCVLFSATFACGQRQTHPLGELTTAEVQTAIDKGAHEKPWKIGLSMHEHHFMGPFFSITVYKPGAWIEYLSSEANRQLKPFTLADVPQSMRKRVLLIKANPSIPTDIRYPSEAESVMHVVIQDENKAKAIQPLTEHSFTDTYSAPLGNSFELFGKQDTFSYQEVNSLCGAATDSCKVFITVIGTRRKKSFSVNLKMLSNH